MFLLRSVIRLVIEQLPQDLRDRFTEMREMDLKVQSMTMPGLGLVFFSLERRKRFVDAADAVESRAKSFFALAKKGKPEWREQQFRLLKDVRSPSHSVDLVFYFPRNRNIGEFWTMPTRKRTWPIKCANW